MRIGTPLRLAVVGLTSALLIVGCAGDDGTTTSPEPQPTEPTQEPTMPSDSPDAPETTPPPRTPSPRLTPLPTQDSPPATGEVPAEYMDPVLADAAGRAGVAPSAVEVRRAQAKQWNDGSLGCPQPGQLYTQAIVDGYWIEVSAGGKNFDYRLDQRGSFRLCTAPLSR